LLVFRIFFHPLFKKESEFTKNKQYNKDYLPLKEVFKPLKTRLVETD